jgi:hypothetical protein
MNNIMDLIDFERRGEYVLADVKSATWFFECSVFKAFSFLKFRKFTLDLSEKQIASSQCVESLHAPYIIMYGIN